MLPRATEARTGMYENIQLTPARAASDVLADTGARWAVEVNATRDRHPANSILPAEDKPMFFMSCVNPVSGFDTAVQAMRPATGER